MSYIQRIKSFGSGLFMLIAVLVLLLAGDVGASWIVMILAVSLILRGLRSLLYYFTMARFMVGGLTMLFIGAFLVDFGVLSVSFADEAKTYILLYLAGWNAFSGLVSLLRAWESKKNNGKSWRLDALYGVVNIAIMAACIIYRKQPSVLILLYCAGLGYSGLLRIINAFRRTEIVYIP